MKKLDYTFRIAIIAFCLISGLTSYSQGTATIYGQLKGVINPFLNISYVTAEVDHWGAGDGMQYRDGRFSYEIPIAYRYKLAKLECDGIFADLVLIPGSNLEVDISAIQHHKDIICKGKGAAMANFAAHHTLDMDLLEYYPRYAYRICDQSPQDYIKALNEVLSNEVKYLENHLDGLDSAFVGFWITYLNYSRYTNLLTYPKFHQKKAKLSMDLNEIPIDLLAIVDSVPEIYDDALLELPPYQEYIKNIIPNKIALEYRRAGKVLPTDSFNLIYQQIIVHMPPKSAAYAIGFDIMYFSSTWNLDRARTSLNEYKKLFPGNKKISVFEKMLAEKKEKVLNK